MTLQSRWMGAGAAPEAVNNCIGDRFWPSLCVLASTMRCGLHCVSWPPQCAAAFTVHSNLHKALWSALCVGALNVASLHGLRLPHSSWGEQLMRALAWAAPALQLMGTAAHACACISWAYRSS
eukprot:scaffold231612_cov22-Tisochrysis_lutea.AAC.1